jgi:hypothetical protein
MGQLISYNRPIRVTTTAHDIKVRVMGYLLLLGAFQCSSRLLQLSVGSVKPSIELEERSEKLDDFCRLEERRNRKRRREKRERGGC